MGHSIFAINTKHNMIYIYDKDNNYVSSLQVNHSASHLQNKFASLPNLNNQDEAEKYAIEQEFINKEES